MFSIFVLKNGYLLLFRCNVIVMMQSIFEIIWFVHRLSYNLCFQLVVEWANLIRAQLKGQSSCVITLT